MHYQSWAYHFPPHRATPCPQGGELPSNWPNLPKLCHMDATLAIAPALATVVSPTLNPNAFPE